MATINNSLSNQQKWQELMAENARRVEVDVDEIERVVELARRTPGLLEYEPNLRKVAAFFAGWTQDWRQNNPTGLSLVVSLWERYRDIVMQRFTGVTPVELRAADKVVANIFERFMYAMPRARTSYAQIAKPLVFGGDGGPSSYYTLPPDVQRPLAIINLPHTAFDHVWQWLALPHETGHDLYASIQGLDQELIELLKSAMSKAVTDGEIQIPDVDLDLSAKGIPYRIKYSGSDFLATVWSAWANEAQADIVGYLNCGGAALASLQQIIGFGAVHPWFLYTDNDAMKDRPEEHPVSYLRNALGIAALRLMDGGSHAALADQLQARSDALAGSIQEIEFAIPVGTQVGRYLGGIGKITIIKVPVGEMVKSAQLAAKVLMQRQLAALGGRSYEQIATFTARDQEIVDTLVDPLYEGFPLFTEVMDGVEPRHALAATLFAFEKALGLTSTSRDARMNVINNTFMHFI